MVSVGELMSNEWCDVCHSKLISLGPGIWKCPGCEAERKKFNPDNRTDS